MKSRSAAVRIIHREHSVGKLTIFVCACIGKGLNKGANVPKPEIPSEGRNTQFCLAAKNAVFLPVNSKAKKDVHKGRRGYQGLRHTESR